MSLHYLNHVWEHTNQKGAPLLLLLALARKTLLSSRHLSRLLAGLQAAGKRLALRRPGHSRLHVVLTGARAHHLDAALPSTASLMPPWPGRPKPAIHSMIVSRKKIVLDSIPSPPCTPKHRPVPPPTPIPSFIPHPLSPLLRARRDLGGEQLDAFNTFLDKILDDLSGHWGIQL